VFGSKKPVFEAKTRVSKHSEFTEYYKNYKKIMLKLNFGNREKLVKTQIPTRTFEFKFGMQGLT